jgi:cyclase
MMGVQTWNRRRFLTTSLAAGALAWKPVYGQAGVGSTALAANVHHIQGAGANALLVVGPGDCVLIDTGAAARTADLVALIARLSGGKPVKTVFNTSFDETNTGGNVAFRQAGAKIIAHENTRVWMAYEFDCNWRNKRVAPRKADELPTETFFDATGTLKLASAGEEFEYALVPQAHTDGDIYIWAKRANVLMAGGLVSPKAYPVLDYTTGGWIGGMNQGARRLVGLVNDQTKIIGSTGPVVGKAELVAQADMLAAVYQKGVGYLKQGFGASDMIAAKPTAEFDSRYGDPTLFMKNFYPGIWAHAREMGAGVV